MLLPEHIREVYAKSTCLFSKSDIDAALDKMAQEISATVADKNPVFLCVVLGGIVPFGNLLPRLDFPLELDYIHVGRYGNNSVGGATLNWKAKPRTKLEGRTVVIVDDILDEGLTLAAIKQYCLEEKAKEIFTAVLVDKKKPRPVAGLQDADFKGLVIEDFFVFGYGLDYKEYLRNAPGIYAVAPEHQ